MFLCHILNKFTSFREFLEHKNATFNENGTLSFVPTRTTIPIPERSVGDPRKDIVVAANLPLLGLSSAATKISPFASLAVSSIVKSTNSQPILNLTVHDFLWGYEGEFLLLNRVVQTSSWKNPSAHYANFNYHSFLTESIFFRQLSETC